MDRIIIQFGRSKLIISLIIVMGFAFGYLNYSGTGESVPEILETPEIIQRDDLDSLKNLKIDFSILEDERYKSLEIFGENPVSPGITGEKKNPFAPF